MITAARIGLVLGLAALLAVPLQGQTSWTLQDTQIAGIANVTTTRNTLVLTNTSTTAGADALFLLRVTSGGVATGSMQIFLEDSADGGTTWNDLAAFAPVTYGGGAVTQTLSLYGRTDGPGLLRSISGTTPGAGADISETVPAGVRWELLAFQATLTPSSAVANRIPILVLDDGNNEFERAPVGGNITASNTSRVTWAQGLPRFNDLSFGAIAGGFGVNMRLPAASRIKTVTAAIQSGDQWSAVQYLVREWRDLPTRAQAIEAFPAGMVRSGPWGDRIRVREVVSSISGSPTGPTYMITAVFR